MALRRRIRSLTWTLLLAGCTPATPPERIEWLTMGTVAAVQYEAGGMRGGHPQDVVKRVFADVERLLNAHDPASELSRLAPLPDDEVVRRCDDAVRSCYEAAFRLMAETDGAFNPRWKGAGTLDLGAIAKGFAVDRAVAALSGQASEAQGGERLLVDLGGNLKSARGDWVTGVRDPFGKGFAARVTLKAGEALATSATYFRGGHIRDGRGGAAVANGVASVTVLHPTSAMMADGLSTALFVLGPDAGLAFVRRAHPGVAVLWTMSDGRTVRHDASRRFAD